VICWPIWWAVAKMDQLTCLSTLFIFLLQRSDFDPSLALQFIERGVVQLGIPEKNNQPGSLI